VETWWKPGGNLVETRWNLGGNLVENNKALFREKLCSGRSGKGTFQEKALGKS
jgi:hypothetical protein